MSQDAGIFRTIAAKALEKAGLTDGAEIDSLAAEMKKKYTELTKGTADQLEKPREATVPQTLDALKGKQDLLIDGRKQLAEITAGKGYVQADLRGIKGTQDVERHGGMIDNNTRGTLAVLGAPLNEQMNDQRQFYGGLMDKNIDYKSGRDDKLFNYLSRGQDIDNRGLTMDMITRLAGTAAVLFG